jgi:peptidoglycan/LPS O-acetylase OafA/YrhL
VASPVVGPQRVASLDGLRGLAVLLVLAHHSAQTAGRPDHPLNLFLNGILLAGWTGVDLFFVLSGFLITGILYDARGRANYFRTFFMRRFLRIFPLYYVSLLILVVLLPALLPPDPALQHMQQELPWYWAFLANVRIAYAGWSESSYILHFWTLAVEEQFYIVWPFLVFSLSRTALCEHV